MEEDIGSDRELIRDFHVSIPVVANMKSATEEMHVQIVKQKRFQM